MTMSALLQSSSILAVSTVFYNYFAIEIFTERHD